MMIEEYVTTPVVLEKVPRITKRQLDHWASSGWVAAFTQNPGSGRTRMYHRDELKIIVYMDLLVNQLSIDPNQASRIAQVARENLNISKGYTWVEKGGVIVGLPVLEDI
jgi:hypothetical protein